MRSNINATWLSLMLLKRLSPYTFWLAHNLALDRIHAYVFRKSAMFWNFNELTILFSHLFLPFPNLFFQRRKISIVIKDFASFILDWASRTNQIAQKAFPSLQGLIERAVPKTKPVRAPDPIWGFSFSHLSYQCFFKRNYCDAVLFFWADLTTTIIKNQKLSLSEGNVVSKLPIYS